MTTASSRFPPGQKLPELVASMGFIVLSIGVCANSFVLAVLLRARRHFGSSVHTLIANQCAMDLYTCVASIVTLVVLITHRNGSRSGILDSTICVLFEGMAATNRLRWFI